MRIEKLKYLSTLGWKMSTTLLLRKAFSVDHFYFLSRPLSRPPATRTRSDIEIAPATEEDWGSILSEVPDLPPDVRDNLVSLYMFYRDGFRHCYLCRNRHGDILSVQWLIRPEDNALIRSRFPRLLFPLKEGHVLVENLFIFPRHRGSGVFTTVNALLLEVARKEGFRACTTFIRKDNIRALNEFMKMGFQIRRLITAYTLCGFSWRSLDHHWYRWEFPVRRVPPLAPEP